MIWILRNIGKQGQSLLEYSLAAGLIALVCVGALSMLGGGINKGFTAILPAHQDSKTLTSDISSFPSDAETLQNKADSTHTNSRSQETLKDYQSIVQTAGSLGDEKMIFAATEQMIAQASRLQDEHPELYNQIIELGISGKQMAKALTAYQKDPADQITWDKLESVHEQYLQASINVEESAEFKRLSSEDQGIVTNVTYSSYNLGVDVLNSGGEVQNADVQVDQNSDQIIVCGENMKCN